MWFFVIVAVFILWLKYRKVFVFSVLKKAGIPGPKPNLLFGNLLEIVRKKPCQCIEEWKKDYGKVFGYYYGLRPIVVVSDIEILKRIQISEFHKFINKPDVSLEAELYLKIGQRLKPECGDLLTLKDDKWKSIRSIITPSFTTSKMKMMAPIINSAIDTLLKNVDARSRSGRSFDIELMFQSLAMDVIGRAAFGINTNVQENPKDPFLLSNKQFFANDRVHIPMLAASFPNLKLIWIFLYKIQELVVNRGLIPRRTLANLSKSVIAERRNNIQKRRPDLLQLMMDAKYDDSTAVMAEDLTASDRNDEIEEKSAKGNSDGKLNRGMTDEEILKNSVLFFLAGYETTSTTLAFSANLLVNFPEVQEKVRKEIREVMKIEEEYNYTSISKLQYLDQVIRETLRLYPPAHLFGTRVSGEEVDFGTFRIPAGMFIQAPTFSIHRDPEYWSHPEEFRPERFSPENKQHETHPLAFQAFGQGPRNCVGARFALMEVKLALARLLAQYRLVACPETAKMPMDLKINHITLRPKNGVWLKVEEL